MVPENPIKNAYFGETHVHTSFSLDAYIGSARLTPSDAYRFAKGQPVSVNNVQRRIGRPLDFAAISVHAEFLGEMLSTQIPSAPGHYQEAAGSTLLAIPQNSNGSKGLMFEPIDNAGNPITREYAERRAKWEPLIEMMQIKGNSETHPGVSPNDEFANFENAESIAAFRERFFHTDGFVLWAATKGLDYEQKLGANPWKLGFIGGTDNHNGTPSDVDEATYNGSHGVADGTIEQRREGEIDGWLLGPDANPGSLAGVWASKNTLGAIFDAMQSRETFATSGPRIQPRFFGGAILQSNNDPVKLVMDGYANGVPMGGSLTALNGPPNFAVHALKDPIGANLDRVQIIKGWVDVGGSPQERIIDVDRVPDVNGKLPPIGNTVDPETSTYSNANGAAELFGHWTDDDFDPGQHALYYMRVIEIPTPRWTTYDAVRHGLPLLEDVAVWI